MDSRRLREAWQPEPGPAAGLRVCVVGDILLDVVVRLDGLIQPDTDIYGHAVVGAGGQAANVAAWIVALGGSAALVGRHLIRQELRRRGVILRIVYLQLDLDPVLLHPCCPMDLNMRGVAEPRGVR